MNSDSTIDIISNLPKNVIECILVCLPIKDAVRTSILSRSWRYEWSMISQLVFDKKSFALPPNRSYSEYYNNHVKAVDHILLLHCGLIRKFKLSTDLQSCSDIDRWMLFLSRKHIKEFILDIWKGGFYKLPSCLYSFEELTYLELFMCTIILPDSFNGFKNLKTLDLQHINVSNNGLDVLISNSPNLEKLVLRYIGGCTHLGVKALKLVDLSIEGSFEDLCLETAPVLVNACLKLQTPENIHVVASEVVCSLNKILGSLPSIEKIEFFEHTLQVLSIGDVPEKLPIVCRVKNLAMNINYEDTQELLTVLCILRSSPLLQKLTVKVVSEKKATGLSVEDFWEAQDAFNCSFTCLQNVKVTEFTGIESELKFIKLILANAPILETLRIEFKEKVDSVLRIFRELIRFPRCSAKAEILIPE